MTAVIVTLLVVVVLIFVWSLCRVAAMSDKQFETDARTPSPGDDPPAA